MTEFQVFYANGQSETYKGDARWSVNDTNGVLTVHEDGEDARSAMYSPSAWLSVRYTTRSGRGITA